MGKPLFIAAIAFLAGAITATSQVPYKPMLTAQVAALPGSPYLGMEVFVTNCRALTGGAVGAFNTQAAGAGTGCLATYNGSSWTIAGTTMPVTQ